MIAADPFQRLETALRLPDLWQQEAVAALRAGKDVVVNAPTGAGKTYVFELLYPTLKGQAVFTVPTRALANDKLAEWRAAGWDVGITTGDLTDRPGARVVVATLETQRERLLRRRPGEVPRLLVVDEYQMLADPARGAHYELALALAPSGQTQLLLLSGSVANPGDVVAWLRRLGRDAVLVQTDVRPVPLEEITLENLSFRVDDRVKGFWPRLVAKAIQAELAPILLFTPRRAAAEQMARDLAQALPLDDPLALSPEQAQLAGDAFGKLLRKRVAYHHSGLAYALRAGVVEPLAKAGQLRAVIATTGLAAGVNFSLRSVLITDTRYGARGFERHLQPDELLQMFGRAGRRGLDERGYVLVAPGRPRPGDARPKQLRRGAQVDWPTLVAVMAAELEARDAEEEKQGTAEDPDVSVHPIPHVPFSASRQLCESLFSAAFVPLGVERCLEDGPRPCGLWVDAERARLARPLSVEMRDSRGEWEPRPDPEAVGLGELWVAEPASRRAEASPTVVPPEPAVATAGLTDAVPARWRPALRSGEFFKDVGRGNLYRLREPEGDNGAWRYGRELPLAVILHPWEVRLVPAVRAALAALGPEWQGDGLPPGGRLGRKVFEERILPMVPGLTGGGRFHALVQRGPQLFAQADFTHLTRPAYRDRHGVALLDPPERRDYPACCRGCPQLPVCENADRATTPAMAWRQLGLVERDGSPTRRGRVFRLFQHGEGLAIAAGLEDDTFATEDLLYALANLRAGPRFVPEGDNPHAGRFAARCQQVYGRADFPGYLQAGVPPDYGDGAAEAVWTLLHEPNRKNNLLTETLRPGDLERALTEWRSVLRGLAAAPPDPELETWDRWRDLRAAARRHLSAAPERVVPVHPTLLPAQTRRYEHRLR